MIKANIGFSANQVTAFAAIILYGKAQDVQFAMLHGIENNALTQGRPLDQIALQASVASLMESQAGFRQDGFLPDNILMNAPGKLAWWRKPSRRTVFFKLDGEEFSFDCMHPGLIFMATEGSLHVTAVKGNHRPTAESEVFHAPYMNVWDNGKMCTGNVSLPGSTLHERIDAWEAAFFGSYFTHPNGVGLVRFKGDMIGLWQHMRHNPDVFPEEALVAREQTAQAFCGGCRE